MPRISLILLLMGLSQILAGPAYRCPGRYTQDPALKRFRKYVQIDTSKKKNLAKAVAYWAEQAEELGVEFNEYYPRGLPVCVMTLLGSDPSLPSLALNSHMDVVPAYEDEWKYPPFSAYIDENGDIYGRGTQDTKDVACQYMEVVRRLKKENITLTRTVHITLMPDEETGSFKGMQPFLETDEFKALNIGFALDEGGPALNENTLIATYLDKRPWEMKVKIRGLGGHGSNMPEGTATEKLIKFMNAINEYRERMQSVRDSLDPTDYGGYTTININIVDGGYAANVMPTEYTVVVDMRLASDANIDEMEELVYEWIEQAGNETQIEFIRKEDVSEGTTLDDSNGYWVAMREALGEIGLNVKPIVSGATTDSLYLRNKGYQAVGFSAKLDTKLLVHSKDEHLNADVFLKGIEIYYHLIKKLANWT